MISNSVRNEDKQAAEDGHKGRVEGEEILQGQLPASPDSGNKIADERQLVEAAPYSRKVGWVLRPLQGPEESAFYAADIPEALKALESLGQPPSEWIFEPACISNHPLAFREPQ
jgi:hypothetical protein